MTHKLTIRAMLLSGVCLTPLGATAADVAPAPAEPSPTGQITSVNEAVFGVLGIGGSNTGVYGRYNGYTEKGVDGFGSFSLYNRDAWDSGGVRYWNFTGDYLNFQTGANLGTAQNPNAPNGQQSNFKDPTYTSRTFNDIGPNAELGFKIGEQGKWGITGDYRASSYAGNIIDSIYTIRGTTGTLNGPLQAWGGATAGAAGKTGLGSTSTTGCVGNGTGATANSCALTGGNYASAMLPFQVGTRRDAGIFTGNWELDGGWTLSGAVKEEHKQGSLEETFRTSNGVGGSAFAMPVDFDSQRYDLQASFTSYDTQAIFGYSLLNFVDHDLGVTLPSPASGTAAAGLAGGPFQQSAFYAVPPSNWAQYVTANFGHNITPDTHANVNFRAGLEMQNSKFPPNTADPGVQGIGGLGLNSSGQGTGASTSPNIVARVIQGNIGVNSKLFDGFNSSAKYSLDGRSVTMNNFCTVAGSNCAYGSGLGADAIPAGGYGVAAYIVPVGWFRNKGNIDFDYKPISGNPLKFIGNLELKDDHNFNMQATHSWTQSGLLGVSDQFGSSFTGRATASFTNRSASLTYWQPWYNLMQAPGTQPALPATSTTAPNVNNYWGMASIAYYQAPMTEVAANLRTDWTPAGPFSAGASFKFANDTFHPGAQPDMSAIGTGLNAFQTSYITLATGQLGGMTQNNMATLGLNASYRVSDAFSLYGYYTHQQIFFNNRGDGACASVATVTTANCAGSIGYFVNQYNNTANTFGAAAEWQATEKVKVTVNETYSITGTAFNEYNGVYLAAPVSPATNFTTNQNLQSYPTNHTTMNDLKVTLNYTVNDNVDFSVLGGWSLFKMANWQNDGCAVIAVGGTTPSTASGVCGTSSTKTAATILQPGYLSPSYNVAMVGAALRIKW